MSSLPQIHRNDWQVKIMEDWKPRRLALTIGVQSFFLDVKDEPCEPGRMEWYRASLTNAVKNLIAPRPEAPTGQINPDSAPVAQGKEADHG